MKLFSHKKRAPHLGPYLLERLERLDDPQAEPASVRLNVQLPSRPAESAAEGPLSFAHALGLYAQMYDSQVDGEPSPAAPIPDDPEERVNNLKSGFYFLDADMVGAAVVPDSAWLVGSAERPDHAWAMVVLVAFTRKLSTPQPGDSWIDGTRQATADLRAAELSTIMADYIRRLGFNARAHTPTDSLVNADRMGLQAGLTHIEKGRMRAPFISGGFALGVVTTNMEIAPDTPLTGGTQPAPKSLHCKLGFGGTRAGLDRLNGDHRPLHMGRYPMEKITRVNESTTLIIEDEVPRVPVRAGGFPRAANGDMGPKFQADVKVFAYKTPQAQGYVRSITSMVPHQDGEVTVEPHPSTNDPQKNTDDLKALAYHLGGDMVGVCRVPTYAWYSHRGDGSVIEPYHQNAVVILLDQGYETMEGASGDDWVSGAQSMRAYMRGAQIAGAMAEHVRSLGWGATSQTNKLSDVLHIPLVLHAGLGEMSRIGELVLNPFVGPRFKSVVMTTDIPIVADQPIDFGLQDFCNKCTKCARECPCGAISFGDKVMFNGAEMWKPDMEKCTKYRLGNLKGSACGRCMKTCPFNIEGVLSERAVLWSAIRFPFLRKFIAELDDKVGNGSINAIKKWWWDLEWKDGRTILPEKGTNARELDMDGGRIASKQKIAMYPADVLPPGDAIGVPVKLVRKEAVARGQTAESPAAARRRVER